MKFPAVLLAGVMAAMVFVAPRAGARCASTFSLLELVRNSPDIVVVRVRVLEHSSFVGQWVGDDRILAPLIVAEVIEDFRGNSPKARLRVTGGVPSAISVDVRWLKVGREFILAGKPPNNLPNIDLFVSVCAGSVARVEHGVVFGWLERDPGGEQMDLDVLRARLKR